MPGSAWWPQPLYFGNYRGPDVVNRRPCGCFIDPVVFGHAVRHLDAGKEPS